MSPTTAIFADQEDSPVTGVSASILLPRTEAAQRAKRPGGGPAQFTKTTIGKMVCPAGRSEAFFWDASCKGFGIRALRSGCRTWIYQYRNEHGKTRRIALGDVSAVGLDEAREAARLKAAGVAHGRDPSADRKKKRAVGTVLEVIEAYLSHAEKRQKSRSYKETVRHLRTHAASMHHEAVEAIRRRDITALLERVEKRSGPVAANRTRATLSAMWTWGLRAGLIETDSNPVAFTVRYAEKPRRRVLTDAELKAVWEATSDGSDYSRIVRLCLLTGCRREEIAGLRWDEIQSAKLVIAAERMKGGDPHEVPLLPMIDAALPTRVADAQCVFGEHDTGFSGFSRCKRRLDAKLVARGIKMPSWGLHDLRRTLSTRLHDAGVEPLVIEGLLTSSKGYPTRR